MKRQCVGIAGVVLAFILSSSAAFGAEWLTHDSAWRIVGREVVIDVKSVTNPTAEESGPLFLSLYAQSGGWYEGGAPGQLMYRAPLESLPGNGRVDNIQAGGRVKLPKAGPKFTALLIERQTGKKTFEVIDYVVFTSPYTFPRKQDGGIGSEDTAIGVGNIALEDVTVAVAGRRANFRVGKLQNQRETITTGTLRLAVYASAEPFTGDPTGAHLLSSRLLGHLAPGDYMHNLQGTLPLKKPKGKGTYYVTLAVEEEGDTGFVPVAFSTIPEPTQF